MVHTLNKSTIANWKPFQGGPGERPLPLGVAVHASNLSPWEAELLNSRLAWATERSSRTVKAAERRERV